MLFRLSKKLFIFGSTTMYLVLKIEEKVNKECEIFEKLLCPIHSRLLKC